MKKTILFAILVLSTSCSLVSTAKYRYGMRKEQNKLYESCVKEKFNRYFCHEKSINDINHFESILKNKANI